MFSESDSDGSSGGSGFCQLLIVLFGFVLDVTFQRCDVTSSNRIVGGVDVDNEIEKCFSPDFPLHIYEIAIDRANKWASP